MTRPFSTRLAVFDCDGTLVDGQHDIQAAMVDAFRAQSLTPPSREAVRQIAQWMKEGKFLSREDVVDGIEKLAAHGAKKGGHLAGAWKHLKGMGKKHGKHMAGAAVTGAMGGYLAHRMSKKEKK